MKKLHQALADCTAQQLEQVAQLWSISKEQLDGIGSTRTPLATTLDSIAARFVWEHLPEDERKVLYNILHLSSPNGIVSDVLEKITRLPQSRYEAALDTLKQYALLLEEETKARVTMKQRLETPAYSVKKPSTAGVSLLYVPQEIIESLDMTGREIFLKNYDRSKLPLEKVLSSLHQSQLYAIGLLYGIVLNDYYSPANPSTRLAANLMQPDVALFVLEQFDSTMRNLCKWLCDQDGKASMSAVREYTGYDDIALSALLHTLERHAIAFDTFSGSERVLFVPQELLKNLKKATAQSAASVSDDLPTELVALDQAPQTTFSGDSLTIYDLAAIIGAVYQQDIEPTQAGRVPKRIANKMMPLLHGETRVVYEGGDDNLLLEMLFTIAQELKLLQVSKTSLTEIKPHYEPGPRLKQWSQMDSMEQTRHLFTEWLNSQNWIDVAGANYVDNYSYYLNYQAARNAIVSHLHNCQPGQWYSVTSLLGTIKAQDPFILRSQLYTTGLMHYRSKREILANWQKCDGEVLIGMLASSLYELGIVAVGYTRSTALEAEEPVNPDAFMVTDFGARVLLAEAKAALKKEGGLDSGENLSPTPEANANRTLVVQPNFELLLLQSDLPTLYSLLPFAVVNQVGVVSRLTLTRPALMRALRSGLRIERIVQILEEHSQKEIAQNVSYTLRDWARLYKEVKISQVLLLEVATEAQADEIFASPKLRELGLRRLGPCAIAVGSDVTLQKLRSVLDKEGIVAHISGDIITRRDSAFSFGRLR